MPIKYFEKLTARDFLELLHPEHAGHTVAFRAKRDSYGTVWCSCRKELFTNMADVKRAGMMPDQARYALRNVPIRPS